MYIKADIKAILKVIERGRFWRKDWFSVNDATRFMSSVNIRCFVHLAYHVRLFDWILKNFIFPSVYAESKRNCYLLYSIDTECQNLLFGSTFAVMNQR